MKNITLIILFLLSHLFASSVLANEEEFPNRDLYPEVPYIGLDELYQQRNKVIIIDVRSGYEYKTLHIKGSRNIPLSSKDFTDLIQTIRAKNSKPIIFYCNGKTCRKSYKAVRKALRANIPNVIAYDAGIFDWARKYPAESELLGKSPIQPGQLISSDKFKKHMLEADDFIAKASERSIILDIRDPTQREGLFIFNSAEIPVPLDNEKLQQYIDLAQKENRNLMIYDAVGKQVRWLQYYLEDQNLKTYYFMKGGAKSFFDELVNEYR
jgi:rhodanese-related sulfurtransferase